MKFPHYHNILVEIGASLVPKYHNDKYFSTGWKKFGPTLIFDLTELKKYQIAIINHFKAFYGELYSQIKP